MKSKLKNILAILVFTAISQTIFAQNNNVPSTKIEVVIGVIIIIFVLVILYLLRLENKISKLEKNKKSEL